MTSEVAPTIVGIGASAGGLEAFRHLLDHLPPHTGLAYVLVQHLDPEHESHLPDLLGRTSGIPVVQAADGMRVEADRAYVIPPKTTMTVVDGHLRVVARTNGPGPHLSIDTFFCSLATVHGSNAIGVVLSGAGSDGSRGIQAIKEAGGITLAQEETSARFPSMPHSAASTGAVDFVLPPEEIAEQLARFAALLRQHPEEKASVEGDTSSDDDDLRKILTLLFKRTGADFQLYRRGTLHRRILRRMLAHRQATRGEYLTYLRLNPSELDVLYDELLIGVTRFFRDPEVFAKLQSVAFPLLMRDRTPHTPIRMWVAGCATGEETYSLAMALLEFLGDAANDIPIQIFGTDLSESSIAVARAGLYPTNIATQVSPERLQRFFTAEAGRYRIVKSLRDLCVFSRQNLVRDPPFSHLDLISCRNVLIYLEPVLQRRIFPIFHYALEPHGILVLGSAESAGPSSEYFETLVKPQRIYQRRALATRRIDVDFATPHSVPMITTPRRGGPRRTLPLTPSIDDVLSEADRLILTRRTPSGVVVNEHLEILQFRGDTSDFLTHAPGKATLELLKLARSELTAPLRAALRSAQVSRQPTREADILLRDATGIRHVVVEVLPFQPPAASAHFFVVLFTVTHTDADNGAANKGKGGRGAAATRNRASVKEHAALQQELATAKRHLDDVLQQHEAITEELRAANEEIQASNEELQSTNEELETTKEEVQATNEELTTLNEELRGRNVDLVALSSDLTNILTNTTIPIVIVDANLKLRRFTPGTERVMRVITSDTGRPVGDIKFRVDVSDIERQITGVIETLAAVEREVRDDQGHWWGLTIRPYRTVDRRVEGAVLVFNDIDASKRYGEQSDAVSETRRQLLEVAEAGRTMADEARRVAEVANRTKSTFLASMSHDLRTPLNAITGYTELLEQGLRGPVTEEQLLDLARIKRSARYLLALINDILNFAKVEAGYLDMQLADVDVRAIVGAIHEMITPQLASHSLHFAYAPAEAIARADPEKLRQILLNLLSNAIKFTADGGQIGIDFILTDDHVRIEVWDTGRGIGPEHLAHIFEPFVQVDRGLTTPPVEGVGLGLAISRDLARAMQSELTVESTVGQGSRFALTLPRAR